MKRYLPHAVVVLVGLILGGVICWIDADIRFAFVAIPVALVYGIFLPIAEK